MFDGPLARPGTDRHAPLAARLRPRSLAEIVGQRHLLGPDGTITRWVAAGRIPALVLWGPPGSGKTTLGRLLADALGMGYLTLDATSEGLPDLRRRLAESDTMRATTGRSPLLFVDELHRLAKNQQDGLLAAVETGRITLVAATTEPPMAGAVIAPLLSRMTVLRLQQIGDEDLRTLLGRGLAAYSEEGRPIALDEDAERNLVGLSAGDGRRLLSLLEGAVSLLPADINALDARTVLTAAQSRTAPYDRSGAVSAMIKSIRGGDEEAALYWLAVQLAAGDDGRHAARRLVVAAGEEVGAADPAALPMAVAALDAVERVGMPEAHYPLAATVSYLCRTGRDWWPGAALHRAVELAQQGPDPVPPHLRPAAKTYRHPADEPPGQHHQQYRPKRREAGFLGDRPAPRPPRDTTAE
ncbi:MAG: AAA family ATPase [Chloroflexota bacterium]